MALFMLNARSRYAMDEDQIRTVSKRSLSLLAEDECQPLNRADGQDVSLAELVDQIG